MIWRQLQSRWDYFRYVYGEETAFFWALVALILGTVALPDAWVTPVLVSLAVLSALALGADALGILRKWRQVKYVPREQPEVPEAFDGRDAQAAAPWATDRARLVQTEHHPEGMATQLWSDAEVDELLWRQSPGAVGTGPLEPTEVRWSRHEYEVPYELARRGAAGLRVDRTHTQRPVLPVRFNGRLLRLSAEPTTTQLTGGDLEMESVTYFDGEITNEMWRVRDIGTGGDPEVSPVRDFVVDQAGRMRSLDNARAANIVGITVVALTRDDQLVFVQQAQGNSVAPGALASAGSGSLEQRDFPLDAARAHDLANPTHQDTGRWLAWLPWRRRQDARASRPRTPLTTLVLRGMLREMQEESLARADEIVQDSAVVTGYFRWVERAMKPEFCGIVRLSCTSEELRQRRQRGGERTFSQQTHTVPSAALWAGAGAGAAENDPQTDRLVALNRALLDTAGLKPQVRAGQVVFSPSTEQALLAAQRFLRHHPEWLHAGSLD